MHMHLHNPFVWLVAILAGGCITVRAGSFTVQPVRIELSSKKLAVSAQIRNTSPDSTTIQARVLAWRANGVEEVLTDNNELLLNPPIFTLKPGQVQFMRVGLRRPPASSAETTYRLILEETPPPPKAQFTGVTTLLKVSIPIFVNPSTTAPKLEWATERGQGNKIRLHVENRDTAHVQIKSITVRGSDPGGKGFRKDAATNVLPGGLKEWVIEQDAVSGTGPLSVEATTDRGIVRAIVEPQRR